VLTSCGVEIWVRSRRTGCCQRLRRDGRTESPLCPGAAGAGVLDVPLLYDPRVRKPGAIRTPRRKRNPTIASRVQRKNGARGMTQSFHDCRGARSAIRPDRRAYWRWGWIDLISSIPAIAFLRWGRLIRVIRIVRVLRAFRSTRAIMCHLFEDPARGSAFTVALATFTLVVFGSVVILNVEGGASGATIENASDALWWAFVTVTTVGYGDHVPVTDLGRFVAALLMAAGVGLFGTLTAYLANSAPAPTCAA
jgi:hypothetical protein